VSDLIHLSQVTDEIGFNLLFDRLGREQTGAQRIWAAGRNFFNFTIVFCDQPKPYGNKIN
jgi:hypothetical protein